MSPIGPGTQGGAVDMLAAGPPSNAERVAYDTALALLRPFMAIAVTVELPQVVQIISMMEGRMTMWELLGARAMYKLHG